MIDTESHEKSIDEVVRGLQTHLKTGLSGDEAQVRLRKYGPNELRELPRPGFFARLLEQFNNFLVIILIVAAVVTVFLGEYIDAIAITVIVVLNAALGVIQESKAEQAIAVRKNHLSEIDFLEEWSMDTT
jgi:Ca2+-transporting ATPase